MNILVVRLGALGDIIHTIPAAAALRAACPDARIDWLVDARHRSMVDLVQGLDRVVSLERPTIAGWVDVVRRLRQVRYDAAIDFQGLMKSAVLARASGARKVIGFSIWHLREKAARPFYSDTDGGGEPQGSGDAHIIRKNLGLLTALGVRSDTIAFPLAHTPSDAAVEVQSSLGGRPFALINPGAAWPNKRWPADRFGEIAGVLREVRALHSIVVWGPGEEALAEAVVKASKGAASMAPRTGLADLLELSRAAALMVAGDTGPLHVAAAAGTPVVGIFGPTDPGRNGPWRRTDATVSRYSECGCHYERRCRRDDWCLATIPVAEVTAAIQRVVRVPPSPEVSADDV
jgi:lipopolysaccharide heptosyltransferase I